MVSVRTVYVRLIEVVELNAMTRLLCLQSFYPINIGHMKILLGQSQCFLDEPISVFL